MSRLLLALLLLVACEGPSGCGLTAAECHNMCYPKQVDRYDKTGCYCEGSTKPEK